MKDRAERQQSMPFEVLKALRDLDQHTPAFFVGEIFAHGDLTVRQNAIDALRTLKPQRRSGRKLANLIGILGEEPLPPG